jgi:hypothetical protein
MSTCISSAGDWVCRASIALVAGTLLSLAACSRQDGSQGDTTAAHSTASAAASSASAITPVRGTITSVSDTGVTVRSASGTQQIHLVAPLRVYTRQPSDLAHVTPNAFVGITSVAQPDGTQRATEIHIFPEELRGTGEGSRIMEQTAGTGDRSTMTNGSVAASRMTNGSVADSASASGSRMTNGSVAGKSGGRTYTIDYQGGSQRIEIPAGVTVTAIAPTEAKPAAGAGVVVLARTGPDGRLSTSAIMLTGSPASK